MSPTPSKPIFRFRTVFISDVHLGFRGCSAAYLLDFLRSVETETLYLVGKIVEFAVVFFVAFKTPKCKAGNKNSYESVALQSFGKAIGYQSRS